MRSARRTALDGDVGAGERLRRQPLERRAVCPPPELIELEPDVVTRRIGAGLGEILAQQALAERRVVLQEIECQRPRAFRQVLLLDLRVPREIRAFDALHDVARRIPQNEQGVEALRQYIVQFGQRGVRQYG